MRALLGSAPIRGRGMSLSDTSLLDRRQQERTALCSRHQADTVTVQLQDYARIAIARSHAHLIVVNSDRMHSCCQRHVAGLELLAVWACTDMSTTLFHQLEACTAGTHGHARLRCAPTSSHVNPRTGHEIPHCMYSTTLLVTQIRMSGENRKHPVPMQSGHPPHDAC